MAVLFAATLACSQPKSESGPTEVGTSSGGSHLAGAGSGTSIEAGGTPGLPAGAAGMGTAGAASINAGGVEPGSSTAGEAGAGSGGAAVSSAASSFACTQLMGPNVASEWFDAGLEDALGSAHWQVKAPHHAFVEDWAAPAHAVWREDDCQGTYSGCETKSPCQDAMPDRLLFVTQTGDYLGASRDTWAMLIQSAVTTLRAKYPGVKRVELLTFVRGPAGQDCGNETTVSSQLDEAQQAVADASTGFVTVGPHLFASLCDWFSGPPHMTSSGNQEIAKQLANHYKP